MIKSSKYVLSEFDRIKPDLVLVNMGIQLNKNAIETMKKNAVVITFLCDTIEQFPMICDYANYYDRVYSFQHSDVDYLKKMNIDARYFHSYFDESVFYKKDEKRNIDVFFVGALYESRKILFDKLHYDFPNLNIVIYGKYISRAYLFKYLKWFYNQHTSIYKNKYLTQYEANSFYNRSKICLNPHIENIKTGWNSRTVEIMGSGSLVVSNYLDVIRDTFGETVVTYKNYEELKKIIIYYVNNDLARERLAEKGNKLAHREYGSTKTYKALLRDINDLLSEKQIMQEA